MNFSGTFGSASNIWYPASGRHSYQEGGLYSVGYSVDYWSASAYSNVVYILHIYNGGYVEPSDECYEPAEGLPVRCVRE